MSNYSPHGLLTIVVFLYPFGTQRYLFQYLCILLDQKPLTLKSEPKPRKTSTKVRSALKKHWLLLIYF